MELWVIKGFVGSLLLFSTWLDIRKKQVSVFLLVIYGVLGVSLYIYFTHISMLSLVGGIGIGLIVLMASWLTKGGIGLGDGGLLCVTGIYLGFYENMELFFLGLVFAALWGILLIIVKKAGRKTQLPFVPFLMAAYTGIMFL